MIFYFTGNGNSRWVAEKIAEYSQDKVLNIADIIKGDESIPDLSQESRIGFVFPIHSWYAPRIVVDFAASLQVDSQTYRYAVCTCGDDAGKGMQRFSAHFRLDAAWSVVMPNTYIPMFELDSPDKALYKIRKTEERIPRIADAICKHAKVWEVREGVCPRLKTYAINFLFVKSGIHPERFHVEGNCVSCGACVKACPVGNIELKEGLPVWSDVCTHCMGCVHTCPQHIIQYGKVTRKRGRYRLADFLLNKK